MLSRVFVTDKKVTVYNKIIIQTSKSGVLFEKITAQQTFSLHKNRLGELYLKRLSKSASGSITDSSLDAIMRKRDADLISDVISQECKILVEKIILGWFGYDPSLTRMEDVYEELLFPALRDAAFPRNIAKGETLSALQANTSLVTKALRDNNSWDSFVMDLCHSTVWSMEDVFIIQNHPDELLPIAIMELPPISVLYHEDKEPLLNVAASFRLADQNILRFMFSNLNLEDRHDALQAVLGLARIWAKRTDGTEPAYRPSFLRSEVPFKRVPAKLRPVLAQKFFNNLVETHRKFQSPESTIAFQDSYLVLSLSHVFRYWFAQNVMEPQLETKTTMEDIEQRYLELFGVPLRAEGSLSSIMVHKVGKLDFCSLNMFYSRGKIAQYSTDLFTSLCALVTKKRPQDKGTGAGFSGLNGYVGEDRVFVSVAGGLYSFDDILSIIELGIVATDEQLTKLGRKITPANRASFLTLGSKERKFKNTWKYYDYGVTDLTKMLALKASKITRKEEIQTYYALPDEMFYEFVALASGKELSETGI